MFIYTKVQSINLLLYNHLYSSQWRQHITAIPIFNFDVLNDLLKCLISNVDIIMSKTGNLNFHLYQMLTYSNGKCLFTIINCYIKITNFLD